MEHAYDNETSDVRAEYEFTPDNVELLKRLARQALESGLVVVPEGAATDYIDSLLPDPPNVDLKLTRKESE